MPSMARFPSHILDRTLNPIPRWLFCLAPITIIINPMLISKRIPSNFKIFIEPCRPMIGIKIPNIKAVATS